MPADTLPTGTVTFLFTDIEGSTRLWEEHPEAMRPALARHDALAAEVVAGHDGALVKSRGEGDSLFAVFARATDAAACACALQRVFASEPWPAGASLRARMALHTGEADLREADYYGPAVNRCARLRSAAHGSQVLLSGATQELVRDSLPGGCDLEDLGTHRLKDLARPEAVFQLAHPALPSNFPPLRSLDNPSLPNNLPQQVTSFVGREKEVAALKALLAKTRLLTLTGSGGSGKTRLSLQVAADVLEAFPDGVWLVELAPLADPASVPQAVAGVLGVREEPGTPLTQTLVDWLKDKRLLLLLDNCEHVLDAAARLTDAVLRSCPHVSVLASSREALGIGGESTYRVPSLSLPDLKRHQTPESLSQYEAVRLFIERAAAARADFAVTGANAPALASVCHRLDGIPLAIELAAARVRSMTVEELEKRLADRFRVLTGGSRTALPRQQTLRALIDWSYDLLDERQKALLRRLSVFAGGWTLEAAETVCAGGEGVEEWEVLDLLTALADKSLVVAEEQEGEGEGATRYRLLETVRQYGLEKLGGSSAAAAEADATRGRHLAFFLGLAEGAQKRLPQGRFAAEMGAERDNLRAALAYALEATEGTQAALRLGYALLGFWVTTGELSDGRAWLERALERDGGSQSRERMAALYGAAFLAFFQSDNARAEALGTECLSLARHLAGRVEDDWQVEPLKLLGYVVSDPARAQGFLEQVVSLTRTRNDDGALSTALADLGMCLLGRDDLAAARRAFEEAAAVAQRSGEEFPIAYVRDKMVYLVRSEGDVAAAAALFEESLARNRAQGSWRGVAYALRELGMLRLLQGDAETARARFAEAMPLFASIGDAGGLIRCLEGFGPLAAARGQAARVARLFGAAERQRERHGQPLPVIDRADYGAVPALRESLGEAAFGAAWAEGAAMSLEQATAYALEESSDAGGVA